MGSLQGGAISQSQSDLSGGQMGSDRQELSDRWKEVILPNKLQKVNTSVKVFTKTILIPNPIFST